MEDVDEIDEPFNPDWPMPPPGDTIATILEARDMSPGEFAWRMGIAAATAQGLLDGSEPITAELAEKLERVIGSTRGFWLRREAHYRSDLIKFRRQ